MTVLVLNDGSTYILSAALPYPNWSDFSCNGEDYLSSLKAINLYPELAGWIINVSNIAAKEARDEGRSLAATDGKRGFGEEGT